MPRGTHRRPSLSPSLKLSPVVPASGTLIDPATRTRVHFRAHILAVVLAATFLCRRQLSHRPPTDDPPSARTLRDRSTATCFATYKRHPFLLQTTAEIGR